VQVSRISQNVPHAVVAANLPTVRGEAAGVEDPVGSDRCAEDAAELQ